MGDVDVKIGDERRSGGGASAVGRWVWLGWIGRVGREETGTGIPGVLATWKEFFFQS